VLVNANSAFGTNASSAGGLNLFICYQRPGEPVTPVGNGIVNLRLPPNSMVPMGLSKVLELPPGEYVVGLCGTRGAGWTNTPGAPRMRSSSPSSSRRSYCGRSPDTRPTSDPSHAELLGAATPAGTARSVASARVVPARSIALATWMREEAESWRKMLRRCVSTGFSLTKRGGGDIVARAAVCFQLCDPRSR
jgi:hypothetical protein